MESLNNILKKSLNKEFLSAIISNPREKGGIVKIKTIFCTSAKNTGTTRYFTTI